MTARIIEILDNTAKAIAISAESGNESPFAYHNFVKGFVRFDGSVNRGSFIQELTEYDQTIEFLTNLDWDLMTEEEAKLDGDANADVINSEYYRSTVPEGYTGFVGGMIYKDLPENLKPLVQEVDGQHGPELQLVGMNVGQLEQTREIRLIVSRSTHQYNSTGLDILATWFTGTLAPPFDRGGSQDDKFVKMFV